MTEDKEVADFIVKEIHLNRRAIERVGDKLSSKVGRAELFGWLSATTGVVVATLTMLGR